VTPPAYTARVRLVALALALIAGCSDTVDPAPEPDAPPLPTSTVYVVRHAETGSTAMDPPLDAAGRARAQALATRLGGAGVSLVLTSQFLRTRETGEPTAARAGIAVTVHPAAGASYGMELAAMVRASAPAAVLIVGHSNTVPATVKAFTGTDIAPIAETEFDRLYTIAITGGEATVVESRY
jgi:probable phosphoglycerate mutase